MKKIVFILSILSIMAYSTMLHAQTYRYIYEYQFPTNITLDQFEKENMVLDINPDETKFYGYYKVETDSLNKVRNYHSSSWNESLPALKWKKGSYVNINFELVNDDLFSYETKDEIQWSLTKESKKIGEYTLKKATTHFGGRTWEAWYNPDIPFFEGPYKFRGLNGLIFEISDTENLFKFSLVKSYHLPNTYDTTAFLEEFSGNKALKISEKVFRQKKAEFFNDPLRKLIQKYKDTPKDGKSTFKVLGAEIKDISQFKPLTEQTKDFLKKTYIPIEKDKAIIWK